jgi:anti-sigma factor RsiW
MMMMPLFFIFLLIILAAAIVGAGVFVYASTRGAERLATTERRAVQPRSAERSVSNRDLVNSTIQTHLDKALAYKKQIDSMVVKAADGNVRARLQDVATQVSEWTQAIVDLGQRVDSLQQNPLVRQDLESVPQSIEDITDRLANEIDEATRSELERTLTSRQNQLASLDRLQSTLDRAEIQIERTLSSLGTIYSQLLTGQSTDHVADYSHLSAEVEEEVHVLQDHLEALEEVKLGRS